jgi:hypothetical protein
MILILKINFIYLERPVMESIQGKIKVALEQDTKAQKGHMYSSTLPSTSALDRGG